MAAHTLRTLLTAPEIAGVPLPPSAGPALFAAFVADRAAFGLHALTNNQVSGLPVTVDGQADPGQGVDVAVGGLRYCLTVDFGAPVERLCLARECGEPRVGSGRATAFCHEHIVAGEPARGRLAALAEEGRRMQREGEGMVRVAEHLRGALSGR